VLCGSDAPVAGLAAALARDQLLVESLRLDLADWDAFFGKTFTSLLPEH
jgi:hypothetical protein